MVSEHAPASDAANGCVYNLGGEAPISLHDLAHLIVAVAGQGSVQLTPWPPERKKIDIGDVYSSYARIEQDLGWRPATSLQAGLQKTLAYYQRYLEHYLE